MNCEECVKKFKKYEEKQIEQEKLIETLTKRLDLMENGEFKPKKHNIKPKKEKEDPKRNESPTSNSSDSDSSSKSDKYADSDNSQETIKKSQKKKVRKS